MIGILGQEDRRSWDDQEGQRTGEDEKVGIGFEGFFGLFN